MTPSTAIDPRSMVAVSRDSGVEPLGYIVWFSVPDIDQPLRKVRKLWQINGLDPAPLPKEPSNADAFRRAVRAEEGRITLANGDVIETDVQDIPMQDYYVEHVDKKGTKSVTREGFIVYQVSRVVKDKDELLVDYPKALRVKFNKNTEEIEYEALGDVQRSVILPMMESIQERFDANAKSITGSKIRSLVRDYIKNDSDERHKLVGLSGENMRGKAGGVYFVLAKYADQVSALADFVSELYPHHDSAGVYSVPMADGASEREMIRRQHASNSIAEIEAAIADARRLLREEDGDEPRDRAIRENVQQHHFDKLDRLRRRAAEYASALEDEQENVTAHLEVLQRQLRKLLGA